MTPERDRHVVKLGSLVCDPDKRMMTMTLASGVCVCVPCTADWSLDTSREKRVALKQRHSQEKNERAATIIITLLRDGRV